MSNIQNSKVDRVTGLSRFTHVRLYATLYTVDHQAAQSMIFSRQEYWSGFPSLPPGDLSDPEGIKSTLTSTNCNP